MIERAKFDGCPVRDKGLQQVGEGGFTQVVLVGRDADGAKMAMIPITTISSIRVKPRCLSISRSLL